MSVASALAVAFKPVAPSGDAASNAPKDDAFAGLVADATTETAPSKSAPTNDSLARSSTARPSSDKPARTLNPVSALAVQTGSKTASEDGGTAPAPTLPGEAANDAVASSSDLATTASAEPEIALDKPAASATDATLVPTAPAPVVAPAPALLLTGLEVASENTTGPTPAAPSQGLPAPTFPLPATPVAAAPTNTVPTDAVPTSPAAAELSAAPPPPASATPEPVLTSAQTAAVAAALDSPAALAPIAAPIRNASAAKAEEAATGTSSPPSASTSQDTSATPVAAVASATPPTAVSAAASSSISTGDWSPAAATLGADTAAATLAQASADPATTPTLGAPPPPSPSATATSAAFMTGSLSHLSQASLETTIQIAAQISSKLSGRSTRFEMGLTPEGLGRVDVSLDIDANGQLQARLAFDNPLAATELRGRADELRRQLENAGFTIARDGFEFTDRQPSSSGGGFDRQQGRAFASASRLNADADLSQPAPAAWVSLSLTPRGVDMKV